MLSYLSVLSAYLKKKKKKLACQKRAGGYDLIFKNTEIQETGRDFFLLFFKRLSLFVSFRYVYFVHCLSLVRTRRSLSQPKQTRLFTVLKYRRERCKL